MYSFSSVLVTYAERGGMGCGVGTVSGSSTGKKVQRISRM
jgi:hypothetical protein